MADEEVAGPAQRFRLEAFDPARHERKAFSCGVDQLDNFLKLSARKQQKRDFTRVWVAIAPPSLRVLGYYAVNSHAIVTSDFPEGLTRKAPRHGRAGAVYLSMFAVDSTMQGRGLGRALMWDAFRRIVAVSAQVGVFALVLDVLDDGNVEAMAKRKAFYEDAGFISFPSQPLRMFMPVETIRRVLAG